MNIWEIIIQSILISFFIYLGIAFILVLIDGKGNKDTLEGNRLKFDELETDYSQLPKISKYKTRDNSQLDYRYYPANSNKVLILIHGSGWHSKYFLPLVKSISSNNFAHVYTPDLRGHGIAPVKRGDIKYINQFEDDINDLVNLIRIKHPGTKVILGGHSSGGGLALRYAGSKYGKEIDAFLLLSPYLKYNSPTMKTYSGGWTSIHLPRIIGLSMLNNLGIKFLNYLDVIDFNMPYEYRDGTETLTYSYRLNTGYAPHNYQKDLSSITRKLLMLVGSEDESFKADMFYPEVSKYKPDAKVKILKNLSHIGVVTCKEVREVVNNWIEGI